MSVSVPVCVQGHNKLFDQRHSWLIKSELKIEPEDDTSLMRY